MPFFPNPFLKVVDDGEGHEEGCWPALGHCLVVWHQLPGLFHGWSMDLWSDCAISGARGCSVCHVNNTCTGRVGQARQRFRYIDLSVHANCGYRNSSFVDRLHCLSDQRVTQLFVAILVGLSVFLAPVLQLIPYPVLFGVFIYMGVSTIYGGIQFFDRLFLLLMPVKHHPQVSYVRRVRIKELFGKRLKPSRLVSY